MRLLAAILVVSNGQTPVADQMEKWSAVAQAVTDQGWKYLAENEKVLVTSKPAQSGSQFPRLWVRYDFAPPIAQGNTAYKVQVRLLEADCADVRMRELLSARYTDPSMTTTVPSYDTPQAWAYVIPNSFGEAALNRACGREDQAK